MAQGYRTVHPQLPSCSNTDSLKFPKLTLVDDALAIRIELIRQIEYGKTVVMVLHSYGGLVGSEAIPEELTRVNRQAQGLAGVVIHIFFYSAQEAMMHETGMEWVVKEMEGSRNCPFLKKTEEAAEAVDALVAGFLKLDS